LPRATEQPSWRCVASTRGFDRRRVAEVVPDLRAALDRGLALANSSDELVVLPTYTAMLALRKIIGELGHVRPYWERAA
jgi:hypothetical protein